MSNHTPPDASEIAVDELIRRLDLADALPEAASLRAHSYDLLAPTPGALVVDVGTGSGRAVAELRALGAAAIGVDVSERMVAVARRRWPGADFRLGSAYRLPLPDGSAAGYRADKVFHELDDPGAALAEARRVLRPGGRIVLLGQDWDGFLIDSDEPVLTRAIGHARADTVTNAWSARRYRNLLLDNGFVDVTVSARTVLHTDERALPLLVGLAAAAHSAGAVPRDQADAWVAEQTRRARDGRLFLAVPLFVAAATRP